jgi:flagellar biosynthesis protein
MADSPGARPPRQRAAALQYDPARDRAPRLIARGEGPLADRIIEVARAHGIPIHDDPALVDLLSRLDVDSEIPPQVYRVVAEIIAFVSRLQRAQPPASASVADEAARRR